MTNLGSKVIEGMVLIRWGDWWLCVCCYCDISKSQLGKNEW